MKKIVILSLWVIFVIVLGVLSGFAISRHQQRKCEKLFISIERKSEDVFVTEEDIRMLLRDHEIKVEGAAVGDINIRQLEMLTATHPAVEFCEVFREINGDVHINIMQRRPVARVINLSNESYYMDDNGKLMPWMHEYSAPVPVINGFVTESYAGMYKLDLNSIHPDSVVKSSTVLDDVWNVMKAVRSDSLLNDLIVQVYVNQDRTLELIPRIGDHRILIGEAADLEEKIRKLLIFYKQGLNKTGKWKAYSVIDLRFKNQVVCTKKTNTNGI
ncbi:MAG: cell division protein FtsQ/DivIB [Bacteroidia bacterium]